MHEVVANLHSHSTYSDGWWDHATIARSALRAGLDVVAVTDHNVWVEGFDGYHYDDSRRVLLVTGEEIHDASRQPQKSHLLVYEARRELASMAGDPSRLLEAVAQCGALAFLAHPVDPGAPGRPESDLSWTDWDLEGYDGLEIWNTMTEFKSLLRSRAWAAAYAFLPGWIARGPFAEALQQWDRLLTTGRHVTAIGGADAHAIPGRLGPLRRTILPGSFLFRSVNTHVLLDEPLRGDVEEDRRRFFHALRRGRGFVAYDFAAAARGFVFRAQGAGGQAEMGDRLAVGLGTTLQVRAPRPAQLVLRHNGAVLRRWEDTAAAVETVNQPGVYRVEVYLPSRGALRGWIFSNP
ncbi:MAG TPA: CehA/McbA family metallohydrolase, partial [Anaerolineales bacterium]|nr:CehA/McbA family metallohydrolase [Anaerolineales bacterium]